MPDSQRTPQEPAELLGDGARVGRKVLVPHGDARVAVPRVLQSFAVPQHHRRVPLVAVLRAQGLAGPRDRARVPEQEDEACVGPALDDAVDHEDVARRLPDQVALAALLELPVQDPVPEHVLELLSVQAELTQRLVRVSRLRRHAQIAQAQLVRGADLGVAVEQDAQKGATRSEQSRG